MDMEKFEEVSRKMGGRLRATAVIQKRLKELVGTGSFKEKTASEVVVNRILDEIITDQISVKEGKAECEVESKEK